MDYATERLEYLKKIDISHLSEGDYLINLGTVLEIAENEDSFSVIINRMEQRQVWNFNKAEELIIRSNLL